MQDSLLIPPFDERPGWMKSRGYIHITPKIDIFKKYQEVYKKVQSDKYVAQHAFFPLIHSVIKERKFKKLPGKTKVRGHSYVKNGKWKKTAKLRPLHYATHIDSMIFGYYAEILLKLYEDQLAEIPGLDDCVIAYRKILAESDPDEEVSEEGKSTAHFASEAFQEIERRALDDCVVLMFDIKSFFSELNHDKLKEAWCSLLKVDRLNAAHFNVFKAATDFRYILKDDLRLKSNSYGRRKGFNEKKLAAIRKIHGKEAFFAHEQDFRDAIKNKEFQVFKHPFVKDKVPVGIPQGLPISAVLANLYLLEFDKRVLEKVVNIYSGFYRRYSDDILIICAPGQADEIENFILEAILERKVEISTEKTERYLFKRFKRSPTKNKTTSILLSDNQSVIGKPLTYLGFEFYGDKTLIKSANLAKFYRRMIYSVKNKASRAIKLSDKAGSKPIIFRNQLKRVYSELQLDSRKRQTTRKTLVKNAQGFYDFKVKKKTKKHNSNYFSYIERAGLTMGEQIAMANQLRNYKKIFNDAITKHLKKKHLE